MMHLLNVKYSVGPPFVYNDEKEMKHDPKKFGNASWGCQQLILLSGQIKKNAKPEAQTL